MSVSGWLAADHGPPFFSFGIARVRQRDGPWPQAETSEFWAHATRRRLMHLHVNTIGAGSDVTLLQPRSGPLAVLPVLDIGRRLGMPGSLALFGGTSSEAREAVHQAVTDALKPWAHRVDVAGFAIDEGLEWRADPVVAALQQHPSLRAWVARHLPPPQRHARLSLAQQILGDAAAYFYELVTESLLAQRPETLVFSDCLRQDCDRVVLKALSPHIDAIAMVCEAATFDDTEWRTRLREAREATGRPVLVAACSQSPPANTTLRERAIAARRLIAEMAALPYVIGVHWHRYYDEGAGDPAHGGAGSGLDLLEEMAAQLEDVDLEHTHRQGS